MSGLKGLDVSVYQGMIDWSAVKANDSIGFVYAKCTEGVAYQDTMYDRNSHALRQYGIPFGAYHFLHPDADPVAQANNFLGATEDHGTLIPMVDIEITDGCSAEQIVTALSGFLRVIEPKFGGKKALIYTGYSFWNTSAGGSDAFSGHPLWIAEYNSDDAPTLPNGWTQWTLWQQADDGILDGVPTSVDIDYLNPALKLADITR